MFFHVLMAPEGIPLAAVVVVLWLILAMRYKQYLTGFLCGVRSRRGVGERKQRKTEDGQKGCGAGILSPAKEMLRRHVG